MHKGPKVALGVGLVAAVSLGGFWMWLSRETAPVGGTKSYIRFDKEARFSDHTAELEDKHLIRSARAASLYARLTRRNFKVPKGTYKIDPAASLDDVLMALQKPISNMFRIPETNLSIRTAKLLEQNDIAKEAEYNALLKSPATFAKEVSFPLPKTSLEGYLYPDTYDLPPLIGAHDVILRQLQNFKKKVLPLLSDPAKRNKILTIASIIELEAGTEQDRKKISSVIHNRLNKGMKLEMDCTVLYALGEWRRVYNKDLRSTKSPYNTYLYAGLPPGPICSPTVASIQAALKPDATPYVYYVARPDGTSMFAQTYPEHLKNIAIARKLRALAQKP